MDNIVKNIMKCRRSIVSVFAISCLTFLGYHHGLDISGIALAIAGIAGSLSAANSWENKGKPKSIDSKTKPDSPD